MSGIDYTLPGDPPLARELAARWEKCSDRARDFVARYLGKFPAGTLPHVIAEQYDRSMEDRLRLELAAYPAE